MNLFCILSLIRQQQPDFSQDRPVGRQDRWQAPADALAACLHLARLLSRCDAPGSLDVIQSSFVNANTGTSQQFLMFDQNFSFLAAHGLWWEILSNFEPRKKCATDFVLRHALVIFFFPLVSLSAPRALEACHGQANSRKSNSQNNTREVSTRTYCHTQHPRGLSIHSLLKSLRSSDILVYAPEQAVCSRVSAVSKNCSIPCLGPDTDSRSVLDAENRSSLDNGGGGARTTSGLTVGAKLAYLRRIKKRTKHSQNSFRAIFGRS